MTSPIHPPVPRREVLAPAPSLTGNNQCSDCHVRAVTLAGGDLKVCPQCFALLWHRDWSAEERERRLGERARLEAMRAQHHVQTKADARKKAAFDKAAEMAARVDAVIAKLKEEKSP